MMNEAPFTFNYPAPTAAFLKKRKKYLDLRKL